MFDQLNPKHNQQSASLKNGFPYQSDVSIAGLNASAWTVTVYQDLSAIGGLWQSVYRQTPNFGPFMTWQYINLWWKHFGEGFSPYILVAETTSGHYVILPLMRQGDLLRWLATPGPDNVHLLYSCPEHLLAGLTEIGNHLQKEQWAKLSLTYLPTDQADTLIKAFKFFFRANYGAGSPYIAIQNRTWADYLSTLSPSTQDEIKKAQRKIARDQIQLRFETIRDSEPFVQRFPVIEAIAAKSNLSAKRELMEGEASKFLLELCQTYMQRGWLLLHLIYMNEQPVAYAICFTVNGVTASWRTAFNQDYQKYSPGKLLLVHELQTAFEAGHQAYDFMHGLEPYKFWWTDKVQPLTYLIFYHNPLLGYLANWKALVSNRLLSAF